MTITKKNGAVVMKAKCRGRPSLSGPYFTKKTRFLVELEHIVSSFADKTDRDRGDGREKIL